MSTMLLTESELKMSDWKIQKFVDVKLVPVDLAAYRGSRGRIHRKIFELQEQLIHKYDPVAIEELEKRIAKLYAIINDLNKVING